MSASLADPVGLLPDEWQDVMRGRGEQPFRGKQVFRWIHTRGIIDPEQMTDLSKALRSALVEGGFSAPLAVQR
jgi:23S rRNA (adenine2503-C2)-methyltransferase